MLFRILFIDFDSLRPAGPAVLLSGSQVSFQNLTAILDRVSNNITKPYKTYRFYVKPEMMLGNDIYRNNSYIYELSNRYSVKACFTMLEMVRESVIHILFRQTQVISAHIRVFPNFPDSSGASAILSIGFDQKNGNYLAAGFGDGIVRVWESESQSLIKTLYGHSSWVLTLSWAPDGHRFATGGIDAVIIVWCVKPNATNISHVLRGHKKWITCLTWEPKLRTQARSLRLASGSKDSNVKIWSIENNATSCISLTGHKSAITCIVWSDSHKIYTASKDGTIRLWDPNLGTTLTTFILHLHSVNFIAITVNEFDMHGILTDLKINTCTKTNANQYAVVCRNNDLGRPKCSECLASAGEDGTLAIWRPLISSKPIFHLTKQKKSVNYICFSPNGTYLASAGFDCSVKLWDPNTGHLIAHFQGHKAAVYRCQFSADSRYLLSCSQDSSLRVWCVNSELLITKLDAHQDAVYCIDWRLDDRMIASGGKDGSLLIWK